MMTTPPPLTPLDVGRLLARAEAYLRQNPATDDGGYASHLVRDLADGLERAYYAAEIATEGGGR